MEFIDCKVPYTSLYMMKKDVVDKTKGTTLTVYHRQLEPHSSRFSLEVLKDVSVFSSVTPKHQKVCILQPNTLKRGSLASFSYPIRSSASGGLHGTLRHRLLVNSLMFQVTGSGLKMSLQRGTRISIELGYMMQFGLLCSLTTSTKASSELSVTYGVHQPIRFTRKLGNYPFLLPNGTSKPEVQATKFKRNMVESSTSESDSHRDHHWKCRKKIQEIDDDSDRLSLIQVLVTCKGKATSSKVPLHLPSFSKHGVQQANLTSLRTENVVIAFEPPVRTSPSSISTF
ncbi:hypothetical protein ACJIZ3_003618 [Penstemon smallii]|uniref:Uncharacterized protein n=1 Tax=Penstemon smallii TaxID=265156 RepID=A0ABD3UA38_9LAMI